MKTLEEFVKEINASGQLQEEIKEIKDINAAEAFLKKNNCDAAAEEFAEYIRSQQGELTDEQLSAVSGGIWAMTYHGWMWLDDTVPEGNTETPLPVSPIIIEDEDD